MLWLRWHGFGTGLDNTYLEKSSGVSLILQDSSGRSSLMPQIHTLPGADTITMITNTGCWCFREIYSILLYTRVILRMHQQFINDKCMYVPAKCLYVPAKCMYVPAKSMYVPAKCIYVPAKCLYVPAKCLYVLLNVCMCPLNVYMCQLNIYMCD